MINYPHLLYWIGERESIRLKKEMNLPKPWSDDPVFRTTYFCNVDREDDKVTKWIRYTYSPHVKDPFFIHNIILSRFLNWPPTLEYIQYLENPVDWDCLRAMLKDIKDRGDKVWGSAYVVTTHGIKMDKIDYLCGRVVPSIFDVLDPLPTWGDCATAAYQLQAIEGISTFMAGQVVADLKNTHGFPLVVAPDWWTFALPGPGSKRGMEWLMGEHVPSDQWLPHLHELQSRLQLDGWRLCCQNIQNCLCEFDKFMRVRNGTGRSKRNYDGA